MGAYGNNPKNSKSQRKADKPVKVGFSMTWFVRIELTNEEKDDYRENYSQAFEPAEAIDDWLDRGFKVSFNRDTNGRGVLASIFAQWSGMEDSGGILTARGATATAAVGVLVYKDRIVCGERTWKETQNERGGGYDDIA